MKTLGIRQAKAHLSRLVRDATNGEYCIVTDNRKPVAMIGPPPQDLPGAEGAPSPPAEGTKPLTDASEFRKALFSVPFPIELNF